MSLFSVHETSFTGMLMCQFRKDLLQRKPADRVQKGNISKGRKHFAKLKAKHNYAKTQN